MNNLNIAIDRELGRLIDGDQELKARFDILKSIPGVAIIAIMRKHLVLANALLRDQTKWSEIAA
jgi:hypothetical protein